ncbi:MAG: signal peptidase II [Oscillibacter sp.]|jgi:signal peptidase II|nr:signal peptidase II [Oscillibacter sp.]
MILYLILAAALLAADQWVKAWTVAAFSSPVAPFTVTDDAMQPFLPGILELTRVHNYGAAWSSFSGMRWVLVAVTSVIVLAVAMLLAKKIVRHPLGRLACALVLSGGLGNIIDRVRLGYVVDMFHFPFWPSYPVFNVADICVVSGAILGVIYYLWFYEKYDKVRK